MTANRLRIDFCLYAFLLGGFTAAHAVPQAAPTISETELVRRTQQLYDAVASGDRAPWKAYYADDAMVYDEKGRTMDKRALLNDLQPTPAGYSGSIKVLCPHANFALGVAVYAYDCEEIETIFGQVLHARYHSVDTWLYRNGKWQIAMSQTMRYYEDPAIGVIDATQLNDFTGNYELSSDNRRMVSSDGENLFLQRGTGSKTKLFPESGDLFFRPGVEGRILFHRDAAGKVDALYDRRNNEDVIWKKIEEEPARHGSESDAECTGLSR